MSNKTNFKEKIRNRLYENSLGPREQRVAVLGSFDTWSYMHKICVDLVNLKYNAITSRFVYQQHDDSSLEYYRVPRDPSDIPIDIEKYSKESGTTVKEELCIDMNTFLKEYVIDICDKAIIIYSLPAAHYNEAEWCKDLAIKRDYKTLGITFVRKIRDDKYCKDCLVDDQLDIVYCNGSINAWKCIDNPDCPFKHQGIAKNQLEYFLLYKNNMTLIAIEKIEKTKPIINKFLKRELNIPTRKDYIYEFRYDLSKTKLSKVQHSVNKLIKSSEEELNNFYEYIDYYYKPKNDDVDTWLTRDRTLRIREYTNPHRTKVDVFSCELVSKNEGFITYDPFGILKWYQGPKERAEKLLDDHHMDFFLKVIKEGHYYNLMDSFPSKIFLENISVETPDQKYYDYGKSIEIELWTDDIEKADEDILPKKERLIEILDLKGCKHQKNPVQKFIVEWLKK